MQSNFNGWLEQQVVRLENEITTHYVFDTNSTPTSDELTELRRLVVIHRFLSNKLQEFESRKEFRASDSLDRIPTREVELREALASA